MRRHRDQLLSLDLHDDRTFDRPNKQPKGDTPDLFRDGVQAVYRHLLQQGYDGQYPEGGYDFPAAAILSRAPPTFSDLHVELGDAIDYDDFEISEDSDLAYLNMKPEMGPGTTTSPFVWPASLVRFQGMFGAALKSYVELRAVLKAYSVDVTGFDNWFLDNWEVPDTFDLGFCTPQLRSAGNAMWGGVSRVLKPLMTILPATGPGVTVTHHGAHRTKFGAATLVDWSRISAIANGAASQLLADDMYGKGQASRLDYALFIPDLPIAPTDDSMKVLFTYERKQAGSGNVHLAMAEAIEMAKRTEKVLAGRYEAHGSTIEDGLETNQTEVLALIGKSIESGRHDEPNLWDITEEDKYGLDLLPPAKPLPTIPKDDINMMDAIDTLVAARVKVTPELGLRKASIDKILSTLDEKGASTKEFHLLRTKIREIYGEKFLVVLRHIGDVGHQGRGTVWVHRLVKQCGGKNSLLEKRSLIELFQMVSYTVAGVKRLSEIAARCLQDVDNWRAKSFALEISDRAIRMNSPGEIAGAIIKKKRRYWVSRCRKNEIGRKMDGSSFSHMVVSQIRAKVLAVAKFHVQRDGEVNVDEASVVVPYLTVVNNYCKKRRKYTSPGAEYSAENMQMLRDVCRRVDIEYALEEDVKFVTMLNHVIDYLAEFVRDLSTTFSKVFCNTKRSESVDGDSSDTEEDVLASAEHEDVFKPVRAMGYGGLNYPMTYDEWAALKEVPKVVKHPREVVADWVAENCAPPREGTCQDMEVTAAEDVGNPNCGEGTSEAQPDFMFDDEDMDEDIAVVVPKLNLVAELNEDCPGLSNRRMAKLVALYGREVPLSEYREALNEARKGRMEDIVARKEAQVSGCPHGSNDDVTDGGDLL